MQDDALVRDSVVKGDVKVTNNITISRDALSSIPLEQATSALNKFYGGTVSINTEGNESNLIHEVTKILQRNKQEVHTKEDFEYKSSVLYGIERDLNSLPHLRFGHSFDSRKQALQGHYPSTVGSLSGSFYECQLIGYDEQRRWVVVWIQKFEAAEIRRNFLRKLLRPSYKDKYDWYNYPVYESSRYLCTMDVETFSEVFTTAPIIYGTRYSEYLIDIEKYTILQV